MAALTGDEEKSTQEFAIGFVRKDDMVVVNPARPGPPPPFRSKVDNFKREMCRKEIESLWGGILLYGYSKKSIKCIKDVLDPGWDDIKDGQVIYKANMRTTVYKVKSKHNPIWQIIKVYHISDKKENDYILKLQKIKEV